MSREKRSQAAVVDTPVEREPERGTIPWRTICLEVLGSRLILLAVALLAKMAILPGPHASSPKPGLLNLFFQWDSNWLLSIVHQGYFYDPNKESSVAFFPLYPALVWLLSLGKSIDPVAVGYALSLICQTIACCILWRVTHRAFGKEAIATWSYRLFLLFPTAFFSSIFYTEGLFACLLILCLDSAERREWWVAAGWAALTALTRSVGVVVALPLSLTAIEWQGSPRRLSIDWGGTKAVAGAIVGLAIFSGGLWWAFGDPLAFMTVQKNWGRTLASPHLPLIDGFHNTGTPIFHRTFNRLGLYLFGVILAYGIWARMPLRWLSLVVVLPLIFMSTTVLDSIPRYLSTVVTAFPILAHACVRWPLVGAGIVFSFAMLQMLCVLMFTNGYFFI